MKVTRRHISCHSPHPTVPEEYDVLLMDDGFASVVPAGTIPRDVYFVDVSGEDVVIAGIRSYGDVVVPSVSQEPGGVDPARQSAKWTLSDCFHGINLCLYMWGKKSTAQEVIEEAGRGVREGDQTKIELAKGDVLACVTADSEGTIYCFYEDGNEVKNWTFDKPDRLRDLKNYYAFCGVLSADKSKFTTHCVWNIQYHTPVGPPFDRRMAKFVGLDFAPTASDWASSDDPIMVRLDGRVPLIISL